MNENETNIVDVATNEVDEFAIAAFDEEWEDETQEVDDSSSEELADAETESSTTEEDISDAEQSDTDEADTTEPTSDEGEETSTDTTEGDDRSKEGHQLYTLKSPKGERECTLEEVLSYANKGMDYDGVRQDRDRLRSYEKFLMELAEPSGAKSVEELMDITRAGVIISKERDAGHEISESEALLRAQRERLSSSRQEEEQQKPTEQTTMDFKAFADEFPDAKATEIPKSVWDEARASGDISGAYRKYLSSQKDEEIKRLRQENEQLKQNKTNKERSTGSRRTAGAPTPKDPFDEAWDSF